MKKFLSLMLALLMVFSMAATAFASETVITVGSKRTYEGKTFEIPVVIENNPGFASVQMKVEYDKRVMTLEEITVDVASNCIANAETGIIAGASAHDITGDGNLFILRFSVKDYAPLGEYPVNLVINEFYNADDNEIPAVVNAGTVEIAELVLGDANGDGNITSRDATRVLQHLIDALNGKEVDIDASDFNGDGVVSSRDATAILKYLISGPTETRENKITCAVTTEVSGDIGPGAWWTNNATDSMIRSMINDYAVVSCAQGGEYVINETVCKEFSDVRNADGSKTFTVKINEGLVFSNGEPITAANYAAYALIAYSPAAAEAGAKVNTWQIEGAPEYQNGDVDYISGVRLVDDYTYSITISSDYVPYYYELTYASLSPLYIPMYASADLKVVDNGKGVAFEGGELVHAEIDAARRMYADAVSAGPYVIKSLDTGTDRIVLEINPCYAGNFEGKKPSVKTVEIILGDFSAVESGKADMHCEMSDAATIKSALELAGKGGYKTTSFGRNGYGKIMFQCDFGPTQFIEVRHAVAYLLDRESFADEFCQGFGSVVHGPYGLAMWMTKESEELFENEINTYAYNPEKAVELLEAGGWVLDAEGNDYVSGIRYKEVTPAEAGSYDLNVTLADGRILMPLHIRWSSSEANPVSELLVTMLSEGQQTADAGMVIEQTVMSFTELLNYMYRDVTQGDQYGVPTYGMYNLATNFTAVYDQSFSFSLDPTYVALGYNTNYIFDEELDQLSMDMVYGVESTDREGYLDLWQQFILRWNELLPEIPLYSNVYYTIYPEWLQNYNESSLWSFEQAIVYASIRDAKK